MLVDAITKRNIFIIMPLCANLVIIVVKIVQVHWIINVQLVILLLIIEMTGW